MINFINTGADEATLKSMSTDGCSEELIKAMNKQGLVQKDVTVQGKNGKTFTRKQWVKASDIKTPSDSKSTGVKGNDEDLAAKQKAVHQLNNCDIGDTLGKGDSEISVGRKKNPNNGDWEMTYTLKSTGKDLSHTEAVKVLTQSFKMPNGTGNSQISPKKNTSIGDSKIKDSKYWQGKLEDALRSAQGTAADYAVGQVLKEMPKGTVIKTGQKAMLASPPYEIEVTYTKGDYDGWQYISKDYDTVYFNKVSKSLCKIKDNPKFKLSISVPDSGQAKADKDHSKDSFSEFLDFTKTDSKADYLYSRVEEARGDKNGMSEGKSEQDWAEALKDYCGYDVTGKNKTMANSASQYNGRTITSIPAGITPMGHGNETYYFEVHPLKGQKGAKKYFKTEKEAKAYIDSQSASQSVKNNDAQKILDPTHFDSIKSDKTAALKYLKDCGITWTENSHAGINWMRAMAAYKAATGSQNPTQTTAKTFAQPAPQTAQSAQNSQPSGGKMSKEDAKKKTQSYISKVGKSEAERKAFMDKVKAQGITWKDKADDGSDVAPAVNWMRCCMAMNKHFAEGGSFDDSDKSGGTPAAAVPGGKLGTKQDREDFLRAVIKSPIDDEVTKTLKKLADGFDPNIDSGSWIQPDHVLNINIDAAPLKSQQYDLGVKDGNAFKKLISDKLKEMGFEVNRMGKKKSADGVSFWFDLSSGNDDSKQSK